MQGYFKKSKKKAQQKARRKARKKSQVKRMGAFHHFPKLPLELRRQIWLLSMPRRVHTLVPRWDRYQRAKIPSSAATNRESYGTFLFAYTKVFVDARNLSPNSRWDWPGPAYANLSQDALRLRYKHLIDDKQVTYLSKILTPQAIQNTRHIVFYVGDIYDGYNGYRFHASDEQCIGTAIGLLEEQIPIFKNLETVYLEVLPSDYFFQEPLEGIKSLKGMPKVKVKVWNHPSVSGVLECDVVGRKKKKRKRRKARAGATTSVTGAGSSGSNASRSASNRRRLQSSSPLKEQTTTSSGGLSTGAIAGTATGIVALVAIAVLTAYLL